jgi:hypothetical protein
MRIVLNIGSIHSDLWPVLMSRALLQSLLLANMWKASQILPIRITTNNSAMAPLLKSMLLRITVLAWHRMVKVF